MAQRPGNWLDHWRLGFAATVLFSHSFAVTNQPDPLEEVIWTTDLGKIAVCGFLIISGYLISGAWAKTPEWGPYLRNRALRIVPGFVVAFLLSVLVAGALGSGDAAAYYMSLDWPKLAGDLLTLHRPSARFPTATTYQVNGVLWTIQLEFACYLLAPFVVTRPRPLLAAWIVVAVLTSLTPEILHVPQLASWWLRGVLMFLSGAAYRLLGLSPRPVPTFACLIALPASLLGPLWEAGLAITGTYLLLGAALSLRSRFALNADVSYGVYLYGWPIQKLLAMAGVTNPWLLAAVSLAIALVCGAMSWLGVERFALRLKAGGRRRDGICGGGHSVRSSPDVSKVCSPNAAEHLG